MMKHIQYAIIMNKLDIHASLQNMKTALKKFKFQKDKMRRCLYKTIKSCIFNRYLSLQLKNKKYPKWIHSNIHSWSCLQLGRKNEKWDQGMKQRGLQLYPQQMKNHFFTPTVDRRERKKKITHNSPTFTLVSSLHFGILPDFPHILMLLQTMKRLEFALLFSLYLFYKHIPPTVFPSMFDHFEYFRFSFSQSL